MHPSRTGSLLVKKTGCLVALVKRSELGRSLIEIWTSDMLSSRKQGGYALFKETGRLVALVKRSELGRSLIEIWTSDMLSSRKQGG